MEILKTPFFKQKNETACGIAALQMAFHHVRPISKLNPDKLYEKLVHQPGLNRQIDIVELEAEAQARGLAVGWGIFSSTPATMADQLRHILYTVGVPVIVCQQSKGDPKAGHYRVVVGIDDDSVALLDPLSDARDPTIMPLGEFVELWKPTSSAVYGGIGLWITKAPVDWDGKPTRERKNLWPRDPSATGMDFRL